MKRLFNDPDDVVREALEGMAAVHPDLIRVAFDPTYVTRADAGERRKVALVSGGGSGHEPMHVGLVGRGMLDAACPGSVFTSPSSDQVEAAARAANSGAGVLLLVKNYSGDVMNFEMAQELFEADGVEVQSVLVADDVAVEDSTFTSGRRGVGATVLAEKICGASAERGDSLADVAEIGETVCARSRSLGVALTPCTVPHVGEPTFTLAEGEMEFGVGIHGEPGRERVQVEPADRVVDGILDAVLPDLPFSSGDRVLAFVNGMGTATDAELYIAARRALRVLGDKGIDVARTLVGNYMTSLDMLGLSITLLSLDEALTELWDAPVHTPALRWGV
ncbi:MAG: dihydroxyacetone kinase subunit DhaK [Streptosporangiaceae bacterium]